MSQGTVHFNGSHTSHEHRRANLQGPDASCLRGPVPVQANWTVVGGVITFSKEQDLAQPEDEPIALMKYAQTYARELERIV